MAKFTDREGDIWTVQIDLPTAREMAQATGHDILNPSDYQEMMCSFGTRLELLWYLVRSQGKDLEVESFREFEKRLHHDHEVDLLSAPVFAASDAFCEACISFFQRLGLRPMVQIAETYLQMGQRLLAETNKPGFQEQIERDKEQFAQTLGLATGGGETTDQRKKRRKDKKRERERRKTGRQ